MKIERLELTAFGPFTGEVLELGAGQEGLHLVYGPNEAGKTSALKALEHFLFGIPHQNPYGFLHPYAKMRIKGALRAGDGSLVECVRRKANKDDLRDANDEAALESRLLGRLLGGLDREMFCTMFGIDHASLVAGGRSILDAHGELGELLFSAGSGIADLHAAARKLEDEADALFKPTGTRPRINERLGELTGLRRTIRDARLSSAEWERHSMALEQARRQLDEAERRLNEKRSEHSRLVRIRRSLAPAGRRLELLAERRGLGDVRLLPADFPERRREAFTALIASQQQAKQASESIAEIERQMAVLVVPESLLSRVEDVARLREELGGYRKAQRDLPGLAAQCRALESSARRSLDCLRPGMLLDDAQRLQCSRSEQAKVRSLAQRHERLIHELAGARERCRELADREEAAAEELRRLDPPRNARGLAAAARRARGLGCIEQALTEALASLNEALEQASAQLARLELFAGTVDDLERLPAPCGETIDRFEGLMAASDQQLLETTGALGRAEARRCEADRRLDQLRLVGSVPSESELEQARRTRDEGWRLVLEAWQEGRVDASHVAQFADQWGLERHDLAHAYEHSVRHSDEAADRLRREADRVAARAALEVDRRAALDEIESCTAQRANAQAERAELEARWQSIWAPLGIAPLPPREMRGWDARRQTLLRQADEIRGLRTAVAQLEQRIDSCRAELDAQFASVDEAPAGPSESIENLIERAEAVAARVEWAEAERRRLTAELEEKARSRVKEQARLRQAEEELTEWTADWSAAIEPLGLPAEAGPAEAEDVLAQISELLETLKELDGFRERIAGIEREGRQFFDDVRALASALCAELPEGWQSLAAEQLADELIARHAQASHDRARRDMLGEQRRKEAAALEEARQAMSAAQAVLAALCQEAGAAGHDELPELERRSDQVRQIEAELRQVDAELRRHAEAAPLEEHVQQSLEMPPAELDLRIERLGREIDEEDGLRSELMERVGSEKRELERMASGPATAVEAAEQEQSLLAAIASDVEHYARLQLASAVLRRAMERFRQKNQGQMLERAEWLFAELSAHSFARLRPDWDDAGRPVLVGVRPDGQEVTVEGMSQGTRDQLYLALRLAGLEMHLERAEPVPLVVDDILIHFDNQRTAAALSVLARLSSRTQVIVFTHHEHLVELACDLLPRDVLFVHRLDCRAVAQPFPSPALVSR